MNYTKGGFPIWDEEFDKEHFTPEEIADHIAWSVDFLRKSPNADELAKLEEREGQWTAR